jgi:hypothetical protein
MVFIQIIEVISIYLKNDFKIKKICHLNLNVSCIINKQQLYYAEI